MKDLPPIDFKQEEPFQPYTESTTLNAKKCTHVGKVKLINSSELRCESCGAGWGGAGIKELYELFSK